MGPLLELEGAPPRRTSNCIGAYELVQTSSQLRLVGVARDLAHAKRHHLAKLGAGLHENTAMQLAYDRDSGFDFVSYPAPDMAHAQRDYEELLAEHAPSGRLFEPTRHVARVRSLDPDFRRC